MRNTLLLLGCFTYLFLSAQEKDSIQLQYGATVVAEDLRMHLEEIASDRYEGRETGQEGQRLAAEYIRNQFKKSGVEAPPSLGGYYQKFPMIEQEAGGITLQINGNEKEWVSGFYAYPGLYKNGEYNAKAVFAGYGVDEENYNDYKDLDVTGKIVVLWEGTPEGVKKDRWKSSQKIAVAAQKGAMAVIFIDPDYETKEERIAHLGKRKNIKLADEDAYRKIPVLFINGKLGEDVLGTALDKVEKAFDKNSRKLYGPLSAQLIIRIDRETEIISSENVLGYIEGSEHKEELVVITAHYDHLGKEEELIYNGADDDGSGTVALLELAEAFAMAVKDSVGPKRSVLFMAVSGEEKGLLGSYYYSEHPVFPLEQTVANLNIDMIGRYDDQHRSGTSYVYVIGADKLSSQLHEINERSNELYTSLELDYTYNDDKDPNRYYYRSDHYNFARKNVPVIFYFSGVHEDYHRPTDTVEKIDFDLLEKRSRLVFHTAWELLNREERIVPD